MAESLNFSTMQLDYWRNATHRWNIKTGATGSGKTFLDFYLLPKRIRSCTGAGLIVLIGNTKGTLQRNVIDPLRGIYGDRLIGDIGSDNTAELFGKKVYCLGADKVNQVAKIQGSTIEYAYGDEITTWSQEVFEMLKSRLRTPRSCFDGTCNPADPEHWFKEFLEGDADIYLQEYTIYDNPFLPKGFIDELCKEYAGTVYYDRFILGRWARAEGLVFRFYADKEDEYLYEDADLYDADGKLLRPFSKLVMGIDFGGNGSQTTFALWGYMGDYHDFRVLEEGGLPLTDNINAQDICDAWLAFTKACMKKYGRIDWIFPDSASTTLINSLRSTAEKNGLPKNNITGCRKNEVKDRPRTISRLFNSGRLKVNRRCEHTRKAFRSLVWDPKDPDKPEDKNLGNINDWYDANCYCFLDFVEYIDLKA